MLTTTVFFEANVYIIEPNIDSVDLVFGAKTAIVIIGPKQTDAIAAGVFFSLAT